jgi:hypothetical protein
MKSKAVFSSSSIPISTARLAISNSLSMLNGNYLQIIQYFNVRLKIIKIVVKAGI